MGLVLIHSRYTKGEGPMGRALVSSPRVPGSVVGWGRDSPDNFEPTVGRSRRIFASGGAMKARQSMNIAVKPGNASGDNIACRDIA